MQARAFTSTLCVPFISPFAITMSVAGLRFSRSSFPSTPLEARSGSYKNDGAPSTYHDWEFRTSMRLQLHEDAIRSTSKKAKSDAKSIDPDDSDDSRAEEESPTRAALGLLLHPYPPRTGPTWMRPLHQQTVADLLRDRAPAHRSRMSRMIRILPTASQLHCQWTNRRPTVQSTCRRHSRVDNMRFVLLVAK